MNLYSWRAPKRINTDDWSSFVAFSSGSSDAIPSALPNFLPVKAAESMEKYMVPIVLNIKQTSLREKQAKLVDAINFVAITIKKCFDV